MTDVTSTAVANGKGPDVLDVKALIRSSRRAEGTVPVCLRGDLVAEFEDLDRQLAATVDDAPARADARLNSPKANAGQEIAEKMRALQDQMRESTVVFRLRALEKNRWAELRDEYPPRKGDDGNIMTDDRIGVNAATFFEPLVRESVVWPKLDDADWAILLNKPRPKTEGTNEDEQTEEASGLSDAQFDALAGKAWSLNRRDVDIPFSRAASRILQSFSAASKPPSE